MYAPSDLISGWDVATSLLGLGADPRIVNQEGETARHIAALEGRDDLVRLLEGGEVLYEIVEDAGPRNVLVARTSEGFFAAATLEADDFVLARRTARGAELMFRLKEHEGLVDHLEDLGFPGRSARATR